MTSSRWALWPMMVVVCAAPAVAGPRLVMNASASSFPDVVLSVHVTSKAGEPLTELTASRFRVFEDLAPGTVTEVRQLRTATRPLDLVFVFDTTASMQDELDGLVKRAKKLTDLLSESQVDVRLSLLGFSDDVGVATEPTGDVEAFKRTLSRIAVGGGGDEPENQLDALQAGSRSPFRAGARRVLVLVTDAPFHAKDVVTSQTADGVVAALRAENIELHIVGPELDQYRWMTRALGGSFYDKDSGEFEQLVQTLAGELAANYLVTYRSPRPIADGTRRSVTLTVTHPSGTGEDASQYVSPALVQASSRLNGMQFDKSSYSPHFAIDGRPETAWVSEGSSATEWLDLTFEAPRSVSSLTVRPSQDKRWAAPTKLELVFDGKSTRTVTLDGSRTEQTIPLEAPAVTMLRISVLASAPAGLPVAISELSVKQGTVLVPELARLRTDAETVTEAEALNRAGETAYHAKKLEESVRQYQAALAKTPEFAQCWSNLGLSYWKLKRYSDSVSANRQAIRLATKQGLSQVVANSSYSMGRTFEEQGKLAQALQSYWWANQAVPSPVYAKAIDRLNAKLSEE